MRRDDVRDEADDWDAPRPSILGALVSASALRRALSIVPLAVIGYVIAWFLYFEPSQNVTAKSAVEAKPEVIQAAAPVECRHRRGRRWPRPSRRRRPHLRPR